MAATGARLFGKLFGNAISEAVAFGAGYALGPVLGPPVELIRQSAWAAYPDRLPSAGTLAEGVAQGQVDPGTAADWATKDGYGSSAFNALIDIANTGPAIGSAFAAWRRGALSDPEFDTALKRTGLEEQWNAAMRALKQELLEGGEIAKAIHRGIMKGDGLLIAEPPTTPGKVPAVPASTLDPVAEAAGSGIDSERLRIMVGNAGLPLGLHEMLSLLNRGEMEPQDVQRGIAESNLRNEYQDVALKLARRLLTPHEYVELNLRGWITTAEMHTGAALSGMTAADADLLFKSLGRPLVVHQITTGLARGGSYGGDYAGVPEPFQTALRESNVRPEWGNLAYANRYTLPGYFVIKAMLTNKTLTVEEAATIFKQVGWPPDLAEKAAAALASTGATAKADPWVVKAEGQLWTSLHKDYVKAGLTRGELEPALTKLIADAAVRDEVFGLWETEKATAAETPPAA